jgi:hypothetical protein
MHGISNGSGKQKRESVTNILAAMMSSVFSRDEMKVNHNWRNSLDIIICHCQMIVGRITTGIGHGLNTSTFPVWELYF